MDTNGDERRPAEPDRGTGPIPGLWTKFAGNPVLGGGRLGTCFDANVVTDGPAPFAMYFSWRPRKAIALVRSDDGFRWTQEPEICLEADPSSGWEDDVNRSCTVLKDGVWHMWYTGQADGVSRIGHAVSRDGVRFGRVRRDPVLVPERDFEKQSVMNPCVRWDEKRGLWRMWYAAGETYEPNAICYAESADGANLEARTKVAFANTLGGYSMDVTTCTSEHAIEHALSGEHQDLPHGAGLVMISLAYYKTFIDRGDCPEKFIDMARALGMANANKPEDFLTALAALQKACGVDALRMSDWGIREEELPGMAPLARKAVGMLFSCDPSELSDDDVLAILRASYR